MTSTDDSGRGRRRDASRDEALRQATLDLLSEVGYDRLTMDAVAARAGAGKATLYRRWSNKAELVVAAVTHPRSEAEEIPDTGSVRGDFEALIEIWRNPGEQARLLSGLIPVLPQFPELRVAFQGVVRGVGALRTVIWRGVERDEIAPPKNLDLLEQLFPALSLYRLLMADAQADKEFARTVLNDLVMPLLTAAAPPEPKGQVRPTS